MNYPRQLITVDRNFAQSSQVFSTPQIKSKSTKIPTDFTMEVSLTSVCCDFLSLSMSKAHFRARFFGVIWIKISDPRDGESSFKNHRSRKIFAEFPASQSCCFVVICVSQSCTKLSRSLSRLRNSRSTNLCFSFCK